MRNQRFLCSGVLALVLPVTLGLACVKRDWSICTPKDQCQPGFTCTDDFRCVRASDGGSDSVLSVDSHGPTDAAGGSVDLAVSAGTDGPGSVGPDAAGPPMDAPLDTAVSTVPDAPDAAGPPDAPPVGAPPDAPVGGLPDVPAVDAPPTGPTVDAAGSCSTDKDCSPQKPLCLGNQCTKCTGDNDCAGRTGTPACATSGLCVACTQNTHCTGAAATCNTATNQCVGCVQRSDCGGVCQTCSSGGVCTALKNQDDPGLCAGTCDSTGACKSKQGQTCQTAGGGCAAGTTCSPDGVCCDQTCAGPCMACDIPGFLGICTPVASGAPHGNRASCGTDATCGGACAGKLDGTCSYPTKSCGAGPTCSGTNSVGQAACVSGSCVAPVPQACPSTGCNATTNSCNAPCAVGTTPCGTTCCASGQGCCNGTCTAINTAANCGGCGVTCNATTETCGGLSGCKKNDGQACSINSNCLSGVCKSFYADLDHDGYPDQGNTAWFCTNPPNADYIIARADGEWDCCDDVWGVNPGVMGLISGWPCVDPPTCSQFACPAHLGDWDCSGIVQYSAPQNQKLVGCVPDGAGGCTAQYASYTPNDCAVKFDTENICGSDGAGGCAIQGTRGGYQPLACL